MEKKNKMKLVYIGIIDDHDDFPDKKRVGNFAYHVPLNREKCLDDFCYDIKDFETFKLELNKLKEKYSKISIANGIPKPITDGLAPLYKFKPFQSEDFNILTEARNQESKILELTS